MRNFLKTYENMFNKFVNIFTEAAAPDWQSLRNGLEIAPASGDKAKTGGAESNTQPTPAAAASISNPGGDASKDKAVNQPAPTQPESNPKTSTEVPTTRQPKTPADDPKASSGNTSPSGDQGGAPPPARAADANPSNAGGAAAAAPNGQSSSTKPSASSRVFKLPDDGINRELAMLSNSMSDEDLDAIEFSDVDSLLPAQYQDNDSTQSDNVSNQPNRNSTKSAGDTRDAADDPRPPPTGNPGGSPNRTSTQSNRDSMKSSADPRPPPTGNSGGTPEKRSRPAIDPNNPWAITNRR